MISCRYCFARLLPKTEPNMREVLGGIKHVCPWTMREHQKGRNVSEKIYLCNIPKKMDQKFESLLCVLLGQTTILYSLRIVCDRRDDAAAGATVASQIHGAGGGRRILRIDKAGGRVSWNHEGRKLETN